MGGKYTIEGSKIKVHGRPGILRGAPVMATDLRASASLVLAGLAARARVRSSAYITLIEDMSRWNSSLGLWGLA
jgi:UDP-N-acetylglucosamine 1-carboxyvinyltransferase